MYKGAAFNDVKRDLSKLNISIKRKVINGKLQAEVGDQSVKEAKNDLKEQLETVRDKLLRFKGRIDEDISGKLVEKEDK